MVTLFFSVTRQGSDQRTPDGWEARYGGNYVWRFSIEIQN